MDTLDSNPGLPTTKLPLKWDIFKFKEQLEAEIKDRGDISVALLTP